jgi:hypothetical protein
VAERRVNVKLEGDSRSYVSAANRAADATDDLRNKAERFSGKKYEAYLGVNGAAKAAAEIADLRARLKKVEGRYSATVGVNGARGAQRDTALILNSLFALGPAAIAGSAVAGGAIVALGSTIATVAAGVGVSILAFNGVGEALKAMGDADAKAGKNALASAQDRTTATRAIESARTSVVKAEQDQARAAKQGERDISDAKAKISKATTDAAWANTKAAADVEAATDDETAAHQKVQYALEELSFVRKEAVRDLEDMKEATTDYALREEGAQIQLIESRDKLQKLTASGAASELALRKARLDVAEAEDAVSDAQRDGGRARADLTAVEKTGVEGMANVVKARRNVQEAELGVAASKADLIKAQAEQTRTEQEGNDKIATAVRDLQDTRDTAAQRNTDAALQVQESQGRLEQAVADASVKLGEQSTEAQKLAKELGDLGPAGQEFVKFLYNLKPQFSELQALAQAGLFPGVEAGINDLVTIMPDVTSLVDGMSKALGDMARQGGAALTDPFWRNYIQFIANEAQPTLSGFFKIAEGVARGLAGLQQAFAPLTKDLIGGLEGMAQTFGKWSELLGSNSGFQSFVQYVRENGPKVVETLASLGAAIGDIAVAAAPLGGVVLGAIKGLADALGFIASIPGVGTTLIAIATAFGALNLAMRGIEIAKFSRFGQFLSDLPAKVSTAGTGMGVMALNMGVSDRAATGLANTGDKLGRVMSGFGKALPVVGVALVGLGFAFEEVSSKADELSDAVLHGSKQLQDAINDERNQLEKKQWSWDLATGAVSSAAEKEVAAHDAVMGAIQKRIDQSYGAAKATAEVAKYEAIYYDEVRKHNDYSPEAQRAQDDLAAAVWRQKDAQDAAGRATRDATAALLDQQNQTMAMASADLAHRQALLNRKKAQEDVTVAIRDHSASSDEAKDAILRLEQADLQVIGTSDKLSETNLTGAGAQDTARLAAFNHENTLLGLASGINGTASPALIDMANKMTDSQLAAHNAMVETSGLDSTVRTLPDGRTVKIATDSAVRENENVSVLDSKIRNLPPVTQLALKVVGVEVSAADVKFAELGPGKNDQFGFNSGGGLATGGMVGDVLPGYSPGVDDHLFYSPTAGYLGLSGGEGILRPEATRAIGGRAGLEQINSAARAGGVSGVHRLMKGGQAFAAGGVFQSSEFPALIDSVKNKIFQDASNKAGKMAYDLMLSGGGNGLAWAQTQVGKPYGWGAVGPSAYDCSGFMAAIMNVMDGMPPYRRRGTTATFPWPGMEPGMGPGLSVGNTRSVNGGAGHMAGTINGTNVESNGSDGVVVGRRARGAQDRLFNSIYHYIGKGGFGAGAGAIEGGGVARQQVQAVAARYGWGSGPQWNALNALIGKESSWDPNAANPTSSARGLFQKLTRTHGALEQTPGGQAEWGLKYIKGRYGSPAAAWAFHQGHNYYAKGGRIPGVGDKDTVPGWMTPGERVLTVGQNQAFEQLVDVLARPRPVPYVPSPGAGGAGGSSRSVTIQNENHFRETVDLDLFNARQEFAISSASF